MQNSKIPFINDRFDFAILSQILKNHYLVVFVFLFLSVLAAFLFERYTQPVYESSSIIQINENNRSTRVLKIEDVYEDSDIANVIELLRSKEFLKRTFSKLDLDVSYNVEGTFLSTEFYGSSPFEIDYKASSLSIYDVPIYISFKDANTAELIVGEEKKEEIKVGQWCSVKGGEIRLNSIDYDVILSQKNNYKNENFYFIINNPQTIVDKHISNLDISLLNHSAKTIEITYSGNNAKKTASIVNTIAEEYLKYDVEIKKGSAQNILSFIEAQLKSVYQNLNETEKQLSDFRKNNRINDNMLSGAASPFPIFTAKINDFEDELLAIDFEINSLQQINKQIKKNENLNFYELIASLSGTKSETIVSNALNTLQELIHKKQQLLNDVTIDNLKIKIVEEQIDSQKQLLKDFVSSAILRLEERKVDYTKRINEYKSKVFGVKDYNELEYNRLERLYTINEGFYNKLIEKKAEYLISQAGFVSQSTILEKASVPQSPKHPIKRDIYPFFILVGLLIAVAYIALRYLFYDEVTSVSVIQNHTKAPILGTIPIYNKNLPVSQLLVDKRPNSVFTESFRNIRSNMQFISHGAETKIITVSSTIPGEGKTFVSINLAGIFAISGKKVIILDFDLRKPRLHLAFNSQNDKGVSTILIGKHCYEDCVKKSELENFDYITAGPLPPNPAELAAGKEVSDLFLELEEIYDFIIIDTPPVGIVTDALSNLDRANYPIYVMKANVSKRHFINNINSLMEEKNITNLSVILNGASLDRKRSYGYGYGSGYYTEDDKDEDVTIKSWVCRKIKGLKK